MNKMVKYPEKQKTVSKFEFHPYLLVSISVTLISMGLVVITGCQPKLQNGPTYAPYAIGENVEFVLDGRKGQVRGVSTIYMEHTHVIDTVYIPRSIMALAPAIHIFYSIL